MRSLQNRFLVRYGVLCVSVLVTVSLFPLQAEAWGQKAHERIAELAFEALPPEYRDRIKPYRNHLLRGVEHVSESEETAAFVAATGSSLVTDIQLLMLIPHDAAELSHYFAYHLGTVGGRVADFTLPTSRPGASKWPLRNEFENAIDAEVETYKAHNLSLTSLTYPAIYLERLQNEARIAENMVKTRFAAGGGYHASKNDIVLPSFKRAVEAVASIWMTILSNEPNPSAIPSPRRVSHYLKQIHYSSANGYLGDVNSALQALQQEGRRVPLTPAFIGKEFFELECSRETKQLYDLAGLVDSQSPAVADRRRMCDEYVALHPEETEKPFTTRTIPRHLYGRDGKPPNIYVYEHKSGLLLLTSKVKELGPDYVLLNLEPIKKIVKRKVVRKIPGEPQTEEFDLEEIIRYYAKEYRVDAALVKAVIKAESDYNPYAVSTAGARGLMQLMPSTGLEMQVEDPFDPSDNIGGGVQYLSRMLELFNNDMELALAAYNAGPGNVLRYGGIPPFKETRKYVPRVLEYYERYKRDGNPVTLKVALNKKPARDYLPDVEIVEEVEEEITVPYPRPPKPAPSGEYVLVYLKNGNTMRGKSYERTPGGIRLELENGSILIREDLISKIV